MKTVLLGLLMVGARFSFGGTLAESQAEALKLYPDLAQPSSRMNQKFLTAVNEARERHSPIMDTTDWPLKLAQAVAEEIGAKPVAVPLENGNRGLAKFVKMTVAQVAASPFTLENTMIELVGEFRVQAQEVEKGIYELRISQNASSLTARLPARQAQMAAKSGTLLVSVDTPKQYGTTVIIHGNSYGYAGLSTIPKPSWR